MVPRDLPMQYVEVHVSRSVSSPWQVSAASEHSLIRERLLKPHRGVHSLQACHSDHWAMTSQRCPEVPRAQRHWKTDASKAASGFDTQVPAFWQGHGTRTREICCRTVAPQLSTNTTFRLASDCEDQVKTPVLERVTPETDFSDEKVTAFPSPGKSGSSAVRRTIMSVPSNLFMVWSPVYTGLLSEMKRLIGFVSYFLHKTPLLAQQRAKMCVFWRPNPLSWWFEWRNSNRTGLKSLLTFTDRPLISAELRSTLLTRICRIHLLILKAMTIYLTTINLQRTKEGKFDVFFFLNFCLRTNVLDLHSPKGQLTCGRQFSRPAAVQLLHTESKIVNSVVSLNSEPSLLTDIYKMVGLSSWAISSLRIEAKNIWQLLSTPENHRW